jgi:hydroxymethylpyrimidine/phosphomethylpyrimidine kinase
MKDRIVCIHSLTAHGVVGLKPFLARLGDAALPVPSLLLSGPGNMPGCRRFDADLAGLLDSTLAALGARGERAAVFVGYLANAGQVAIVEDMLDRHGGVVSAVVVDPVSGDDGRAYVGAELIAAWPRLLARATWALPNLTEVELFTGQTGEAGVAALRARWPELKLIVTGWPAGDDVVTRLYDGPGEGVEHRQARVAGSPSGTGDLFAAEWMREVFLRGTTPDAAMARAAEAVARALRAGGVGTALGGV